MSGEIATYMRDQTGARALGVDLPHATVLVRPLSAEHQADAEATARAVQDTHKALADAAASVAEAQSMARRERALRLDAEREMRIMCGTETIAAWSPPMFARECDGMVWLGAEHDWRRHIALIFDSWAELRRAHPSLAPAGVKLDPDGQPAVRMKHIPIVEAAQPAARGGA